MSGEPQAAAGRNCRRVVLKISGEGFVHPGERGIAMDAVVHIARQTFQAAKHGAQIAIVVGGGNILRGAQWVGLILLLSLVLFVTFHDIRRLLP